jgi:hypothetical protein
MKFGTALRNNLLEAYELSVNGQTLNAGAGSGASVTGTAAPPRILAYTGAEPANCAAAATGTKFADTVLPADWLSAASAGVKSLAGSWTGTALAALNLGVQQAYYRLVDSTGVCHEQGSITTAGNGGDAIIDTPTLGVGQTFNVTSKTLTAPNA